MEDKENELERLIKDTANNLHMCDEKELKKRFIELKNILSKKAFNSFAEAINDRMGVTAQEVMDKTVYSGKGDGWVNSEAFKDPKEWKDLHIDNLPERFFTRDDIEFQFQFKCDGTWGTPNLTHLKIIEKILNDGDKYRYRLKPLDINKEFNIALHLNWFDGITYDKGITYYKGHRVGIIG